MFAGKPISPGGRHVVITGTSTGLGRETALFLADRGFYVFCGVRKREDGEALAAACTSGRVDPVILDVTDAETIAAAAAHVSQKVGRQGLWALVNNAGICVSAPLECVSSELFRHQLEVNLVGQLAVTQAMLPLLRKGGAGRLVNMTSGLGTVAIPYLGPYSAAQFAKEGLSDALRRELGPMGIAVSVVSPGAIWTPIWGKIADQGKRLIAAAPNAIGDLYRETYLRFLDANEQSARASRTTPADVASAVHAALTAARPKTRYRVGADVRQSTRLAWLLPDTTIDGMFRPIVTPMSAAKKDRHVRS